MIIKNGSTLNSMNMKEIKKFGSTWKYNKELRTYKNWILNIEQGIMNNEGK